MWGISYLVFLSEYLVNTRMNLIDTEQCEDYFQTRYNTTDTDIVINGVEICAGDYEGLVSACDVSIQLV